MGFSLADWTILILVAFALAFGNQFRYWRRLPGIGPLITEKSGALHRVSAYIYGTGWILIGFTLWCIDHPEYWAALKVLVGVCVAAGAGAILPRIALWITELQEDREDKEEFEQKWRDQRKSKSES